MSQTFAYSPFDLFLSRFSLSNTKAIMTPVYLNPQTSSPIPNFLELKGDQQHGFQVFSHDHDLASSSNNSCISYNNSFNSHSSQETLSIDYSRHAGHSKVERLVLSNEKASDVVQPWLQSSTIIGDNSYGYSFNLQEEEKVATHENCEVQNNNKFISSSKKWKPSKMQKMMVTSNKKHSNDSKQVDHQGRQQRQQNSDGIRVCSDCHTTTTPLWRSGPQGPKSLCNACGIRQRKARRAAMAAAAGFGNDSIVTTPPMPSPPVEARKSANKAQEMKVERGFVDQQDKNHTLPIKKRSKVIVDASKNNHTQNSHNSNNNNTNDAKELCFEDLSLSSNKDYLNPNPTRSFPRDEEEGAILLMELSCGLA